MANQDGAGIITDNQNDPGDGNKKEKKQKNVKEAQKSSNIMPNQKDFYGLKTFDNDPYEQYGGMDILNSEND